MKPIAPSSIKLLGLTLTTLLGFWFAPSKNLAATAPDRSDLARQILSDTNLTALLREADQLLKSGFNAGTGYGEVWIRDFNTFIEGALLVNDPKVIREQLLTFFKFQGPEGDIVDGFIPAATASVGYRYRKSELVPKLVAHKNTVETDQESSLIQAVCRYVRQSGDTSLLDDAIADQTVRERLHRALEYVHQYRFDNKHGLVWGATTTDWETSNRVMPGAWRSTRARTARSTSMTTRSTCRHSRSMRNCRD